MYFYFVMNLPEKLMTYVRLQLNLPLPLTQANTIVAGPPLPLSELTYFMNNSKEPSIWFVFWWLASELCHHAWGILKKYAPFEICSRTHSIVLARCLLYLCLTFAMLMECRLWLAVFTVLRLGKEGRYGFEISGKHRRLAFVFILLVKMILFCKTIKGSKYIYIYIFKFQKNDLLPTIFALLYGGKPHTQECIFQRSNYVGREPAA